MEKLITFEMIRNFAYVNDRIVEKPVKGVVVSFFGLGNTDMMGRDEEDDMGRFYAEKGILYIYPYNYPWNWMNEQAVKYTDDVVDAVFSGLGLPDSLPIVSTGGSMGGQSALVYTRYAKRVPVACVVNCPVCDVPYHYTERFDLPRTFYSALYNYDCSLNEALESISPLHLADGMPDTKFYVFHCDKDRAVNIDMHSRKFIEKMKEKHDIEFYVVPDMGHCDLTPEANKRYHEIIVEEIEANAKK